MNIWLRCFRENIGTTDAPKIFLKMNMIGAAAYERFK